MDLNTLTPSDKSQIFEISKNYGIEANDPMVGVLLAIKGVERGIVNQWKEERAELSQIKEGTGKVLTELDAQLSIQKKIAEVFDAQARFFQTLKKGVFVGFWASLLVGSVLGVYIAPYFNSEMRLVQEITKNGGSLQMSEERDAKILRLKTSGLIGLTRSGQDVEFKYLKAKE